MKEVRIEKRKTYSIDSKKANFLGRVALDLTEEMGKSVPKKDILDALIDCLKDKAILNKVTNIIKKLS